MPPRTDRPSYATIHDRLRRWRGSAKAHTCSCGQPAAEWAYDHSDPNELSFTQADGLVLAYSVDLDRYQPRCRSCHKSGDLDRHGRSLQPRRSRSYPTEQERRGPR